MAPSHPESTRFDVGRRASRVSRLSPTAFRGVDLHLQTKLKQPQEIHLLTSVPTATLFVKRPAKNQLRRGIMSSSHSPEPMVDKRRFSDTGPGNDCDDIYVRVCPSVIQGSDILLSAKKIASCTGNLAIEIFFGASLAGALRVAAREAAEGVFCRL